MAMQPEQPKDQAENPATRIFREYLERKERSSERNAERRGKIDGKDVVFDDFYKPELDTIQPSDSIVELGCGTGTFTTRILSRIKQGSILAIDPSYEMIANASKNVPDNRVRLVQGRAEEIPCDTGSVDKVVSYGLVFHYFDKTKALREINRVLGENGAYLFDAKIKTEQSPADLFADAVEATFLKVWGLTISIDRDPLKSISDPYSYFSALAQESGFVMERYAESTALWAPDHLRDHFNEMASILISGSEEFAKNGELVKTLKSNLEAALEEYEKMRPITEVFATVCFRKQ